MAINRYALDAWRMERGLSLTDLATATGYDRTTVGKIIRGERNASPGFIASAAEAMDVDRRVLMHDPNTPERSEGPGTDAGSLAGDPPTRKGDR